VQVGMGTRLKEDEKLARYTCIALQKLANDNSTRFKPTHHLFQKLAELVKDRSVTHSKWYASAEQAINAIYVLSESPDKSCSSIIKDMAVEIFPSFNQDQNEASDLTNDVLNCSISDLSKFVFALGHVALKQLVHIEEIQSELRKRRSSKEKKAQEEKGKKKKSAIEEELGVVEAAEETEGEFLQEKAEREIVGGNLLGTFGPAVALICANAGNKFNDHTLRTSAVLALCKFMCVSSEFCEKHLQLLFTILKLHLNPPFVQTL